MNAVISGPSGVIGIVVLIFLLGGAAVFAYRGAAPDADVLTESLSEPLGGAKTATVDIHAGDGNLVIDRQSGDEGLLASGTLQYTEKQGLPTRTLNESGGHANLTMRGGAAGQPWFKLPWSACNGATEWQIHLNPAVALNITAHSDGGNVKLDLAGMAVTALAADTGGGGVDVVLPDNAANLDISAKTGAGNVSVAIGSGSTGSSVVNASSGAGNVEVRIPTDVAARIHATSGLGKAIMDAHYAKVDANTWQSADYESAANKVEITMHSGAGNVIVSSK